MIAATASEVDRARSVSSMRSRNLPPWWRAKSQLNSAVRAPPMCKNPVGEGAKRTTTLILSYAAAVVCVLRDEFTRCRPVGLQPTDLTRREGRDPSIRLFRLLPAARCLTNGGQARAAARWTPAFAGATSG